MNYYMNLPTDLDISQNQSGTHISIVYKQIQLENLKKEKFFDDCIMNTSNKKNTIQISSPDVFIFHKSRCGSTLICNILQTNPDVVVFCEPNIVNKCFQLLTVLNVELIKALINKIILVFCSECRKINKKVIFKLSSYSLQYIDIFKDIYPDTTYIYLTRDTLEVLRSNLSKPTNNIRENRLGLVNRFSNFSKDEHYLNYIFKMDDLGKKCQYQIDYNDILKPDFTDKIIRICNLNPGSEVLEKMSEIKNVYSKTMSKQKYVVTSGETVGIEIYDNVISKEKCLEICNLIDNLGKETKIAIKKCVTFSLFDLDFWDKYDAVSTSQEIMNVTHNEIFNMLIEVVYQKLTKFTEKYPEFYNNLCMKKTNYIYQDLRSNTDIVSINFTKYNPRKHDCSVWHSENSHMSIDESTRKVAFIYYLNDVSHGGETEFYFQKIVLKPRMGRLVLFSPDWPCTHRGNMPISGVKYILTGWVHSKIYHNNNLYPFYNLKHILKN